MSLSKVRQNFHAKSEATINKQINMELYASYVYMSMVSRKKIQNTYIFQYASSTMSHNFL